MMRIFRSLTVLLLLVTPLITSGADMDDLKAADELARKLNYSLDPNDIDTFVGIFHEEILYTAPDTALPVSMKKEQIRQWKEGMIASAKSVSFTLKDVKYSLVGNTGIASLIGTVEGQAKNGATMTGDFLYTITYVKKGGNWLIVAFHASVAPYNV